MALGMTRSMARRSLCPAGPSSIQKLQRKPSQHRSPPAYLMRHRHSAPVGWHGCRRRVLDIVHSRGRWNQHAWPGCGNFSRRCSRQCGSMATRQCGLCIQVMSSNAHHNNPRGARTARAARPDLETLALSDAASEYTTTAAEDTEDLPVTPARASRC